MILQHKLFPGTTTHVVGRQLTTYTDGTTKLNYLCRNEEQVTVCDKDYIEEEWDESV